SSRRRHTRSKRDWSSDVCSSDLFKRHLVKTGFRFMRETGRHINPEDPAFTYQNYADLLANVVNSHNTTYGAPPHGSRMDQYGARSEERRVGKECRARMARAC